MAVQAQEHKQRRAGAMTLTNVAVAALLVALLFGIGGTFAAVNDAVNHAGNEGYADAKLLQTWGNQPVTSIYPGYTQDRTAIAENNGTEAMYVRMKLSKFWADRDSRTDEEDGTNKTESKDATGNNGTLTPTSDPQFNADYIEVGIADTEKWVDGEDGWWYYTDVIEPGQQSTSLISSVGISTAAGEENNDGQSTAEKHGNMPSAYLTEAAVLDVELQAVTTYPEKGKSDDGGASDASGKKASYVKSAFIPKTGDGLSPLVITLFALALLALCVCFILFIVSRKRAKEEDAQETTTHLQL